MTNQNRVRLMYQFEYFHRHVQIHAMETAFARIQNVLVFLVGLVMIALLEYANLSVPGMGSGMNFLENVLVTMDGKEPGAISKKKSARHVRMASASMESAFAMKGMMGLPVNS